MSETPATAGTAQGTSANAAAGGAAPTGESPEQKLAAAMAENQQLRSRYDNAQQLLARQGQELGTLRKTAKAADVANGYQDTDDSPHAAVPGAIVEKIAGADKRLDLMQFRQENPDWATFQPEMDKILLDEVRIYDVVAWKPDGFGNVTVDWYKTYRAAKDKVELDALRSARLAAAQTQENMNEQRDAAKQMATLSGTNARVEDRELTIADIKGKTAKEIAALAKSLGMVPEHDPPSTLR